MNDDLGPKIAIVVCTAALALALGYVLIDIVGGAA